MKINTILFKIFLIFMMFQTNFYIKSMEMYQTKLFKKIKLLPEISNIILQYDSEEWDIRSFFKECVCIRKAVESLNKKVGCYVIDQTGKYNICINCNNSTKKECKSLATFDNCEQTFTSCIWVCSDLKHNDLHCLSESLSENSINLFVDKDFFIKLFKKLDKDKIESDFFKNLLSLYQIELEAVCLRLIYPEHYKNSKPDALFLPCKCISCGNK